MEKKITSNSKLLIFCSHLVTSLHITVHGCPLPVTPSTSFSWRHLELPAWLWRPRDVLCTGEARPSPRSDWDVQIAHGSQSSLLGHRFGNTWWFCSFKPCHSFPGSSSEDREYRAFTARVSRADKRLPDVGVVFFVCLFWFSRPALQILESETTSGQHFAVLIWTVAQHMGFV